MFCQAQNIKLSVFETQRQISRKSVKTGDMGK